jgi:hypothetical protein
VSDIKARDEQLKTDDRNTNAARDFAGARGMLQEMRGTDIVRDALKSSGRNPNRMGLVESRMVQRYKKRTKSRE